jgi:hypothetical protein
MTIKKLWIYSLAFLLPLTPSLAHDIRQTQLWSTTDFYTPLAGRMSGRVQAQARTLIRTQKLVHRHVEFELIRPLLPFLSFGGGYRQSDFSQGAKTEKDHMPFFTLRTQIHNNRGWGVSYRARADYLFLENMRSQDAESYRHLISLDIPVRVGRGRMISFISNELFFQKGRRFNENRLKVGLRDSMNKKVFGDIFYQLRSRRDESKTWELSSDIGFYTTFLF